MKKKKNGVGFGVEIASKIKHQVTYSNNLFLQCLGYHETWLISNDPLVSTIQDST